MKNHTVVFLLTTFIISLTGNNLYSKNLLPNPNNEINSFKIYHDSLKVYDYALINDSTEELRSAASYKIIKTLAKALRTEGSYSYSFDSLKSIAILTPDDNQFRIFTWQLSYDNGTYRYFGVIQTNELHPKLQPLVDYESFYEEPKHIIVDADRWIGALYYNMISVKKGKTTYYTLLGWNANNSITNKKVIDILWFDKDGKAKFGYPLFNTGKKETITRIILEYKKDAVLSLNYYPDLQQIFYDHLVSLSGSSNDEAFDKVPDGTLEAYEWKKGMWNHIDVVDYEKRKDGEAPNVIRDKQKPQLYQPLQKR
ncbi:MAG: hypothetical protein M9887_12090 [Chitinophagales bacterium]|nr:hypothetical protein [Chitinophagales bacterium]